MGTLNYRLPDDNLVIKTTSNLVVHPQYNSSGLRNNDIALLKLEEEIRLTGKNIKIKFTKKQFDQRFFRVYPNNRTS
jgi:hypothetical protein